MNIRAVVLALVASSSSVVFADIVIVPAAPTSADTVTIRVEDIYSSGAHVTSASITQVGNAFVVQQDVVVDCIPPPPPPAAASVIPWVGSQFQVGALPAGAYTVTAHINVTGCSISFTETSGFVVIPAVPVLGWRALVFLAAALAVTALGALGVRR